MSATAGEWPFQFQVYGTPVTKGSNFIVVKGRLVQKHSGKLKKWERNIRESWALANPPREPLDEPCEVYLKFFLAKPKKPRFPFPAVYPDIDKLARAVLDGIQSTKTQAGLVKDDARVVSLGVEMVYAEEGDHEGVTVVIDRWSE